MPALTLTTSRKPEQHVTIDDTDYPMAVGGVLPAKDVDMLARMMGWLAFAARLLAGEATGEAPSGFPADTAALDAQLLRAVKIVLPTAPEDVLIAIGRDGQAQVIATFFRPGAVAPSTPPSSSQAVTPASISPTSRPSTAAPRKAGRK